MARQVGVGAVLFTIFNSRIKDVDFWWGQTLAFEGETGPEVVHTHARACSVLKSEVRAQEALNNEQWDPEALQSRGAGGAVAAGRASRRRCAAPVQKRALRSAAAHHGACQAFNRFYFEHRIITDDQKKTAANLRLCAAVKTVIKTGLFPCGDKAPERM